MALLLTIYTFVQVPCMYLQLLRSSMDRNRILSPCMHDPRSVARGLTFCVCVQLVPQERPKRPGQTQGRRLRLPIYLLIFCCSCCCFTRVKSACACPYHTKCSQVEVLVPKDSPNPCLPPPVAGVSQCACSLDWTTFHNPVRHPFFCQVCSQRLVCQDWTTSDH